MLGEMFGESMPILYCSMRLTKRLASEVRVFSFDFMNTLMKPKEDIISTYRAFAHKHLQVDISHDAVEGRELFQ